MELLYPDQTEVVERVDCTLLTEAYIIYLSNYFPIGTNFDFISVTFFSPWRGLLFYDDIIYFAILLFIKLINKKSRGKSKCI